MKKSKTTFNKKKLLYRTHRAKFRRINFEDQLLNMFKSVRPKHKFAAISIISLSFFSLSFCSIILFENLNFHLGDTINKYVRIFPAPKTPKKIEQYLNYLDSKLYETQTTLKDLEELPAEVATLDKKNSALAEHLDLLKEQIKLYHEAPASYSDRDSVRW